MGRGIAQVFAQRGWQVVLSDPAATQLSSAMNAIDMGLRREVEKGPTGRRGKESLSSEH